MNAPTLEPGLYRDVPMAEYLALPYMSASKLEVLNRSPLQYRHSLTAPQQTTDALARGTALHMAVLEPLLDIADAVVVTRGTEAHSGIGSVMDEMIAQDIGALADPEAGDGVRSWQRFRATVAGGSFDVAHHPGTGHARPWTRGGDANRLAAMVTYAYAERRQPPPMVTVRGHNHKPSDSADNHPTRAVILPSWQLSTAFGHRLGGDWLPVGAAWWECDGGEYVLRKFYRDWPLRRAPRIEELMP